MSLLSRLRDALLFRKPASDRGFSTPAPTVHNHVDRLPPFSLQTAELMRFDPQVRIGLGTRNGLLMAGKALVTGPRPEVVRWVQSQWEQLWCLAAPKLLKAKLYGFVPLELTFREAAAGELAGAIEVREVRDHHPRHARLLVRDGEPAGFLLKLPGAGERSLLAPQALVCTFDAEFGNPYGCALLERAYPAWFEKWMEGGAKQTLRLRMIKDGYIGDILWYPPDRTVQLGDGRTVSWREIAQEMVESRTSGGALTLPMIRDSLGNKLVDYTPPHDLGRGTAIFRWKRDVDHEIWKSLEVPPEIIEASFTGSGYSGRWIPFVVALSAVQAEFAELVHCVDRDVLRPLVALNFPGSAAYSISACSLVEQYTQQVGATQPGGSTANA
jgi:hypothetical protein